MQVPLVDLGWQHRQIEDELRGGLEQLFQSSAYVLGPAVAEFEEDFARFMGARHCIGVGSGTDALELALRALGVGARDEVIVPANTFIASALAVVRAGASPVLVDIDPATHLIDPAAVEAAIGDRTRAIMPVHLYGQAAQVERLRPLAEGAGLVLLEDAAQAQGAKRGGEPVGTLGDAAATSFYPGKNIGAYGDGGAVLSSDDEIADRLARLRNWGSDQKYHHPELGFNSRLDTLQAVVLRAKLARLAGWNGLRREAAARYDALLGELPGLELPHTLAGNEHVWHLYVVRVVSGERRAARDAVVASLHEQGVSAGIHYPVPIHLQGAFAQLGLGPGSFPHSERAADEILSLPLFPGITVEQQTCVADALKRALGAG